MASSTWATIAAGPASAAPDLAEPEKDTGDGALDQLEYTGSRRPSRRRRGGNEVELGLLPARDPCSIRHSDDVLEGSGCRPGRKTSTWADGQTSPESPRHSESQLTSCDTKNAAVCQGWNLSRDRGRRRGHGRVPRRSEDGSPGTRRGLGHGRWPGRATLGAAAFFPGPWSAPARADMCIGVQPGGLLRHTSPAATGPSALLVVLRLSSQRSQVVTAHQRSI